MLSENDVQVGDRVRFELVHGHELIKRMVTVTVTELGDAELPSAWFYGNTDEGVRYGLPTGFMGVERV